MRLTDREFFYDCIDYSQPGLESVADALAQNDFNTCRKRFAQYVRQTLKPNLFFGTLPECIRIEMLFGPTCESDDCEPLSYEEEIEKNADEACRHYMISCCIPYDFNGKTVDWSYNPTYNKYSEWSWQLSRHRELANLALAYRLKPDKKYADACAELFESWHSQLLAPENEPWNETIGWRTIECGIRQGLVWPLIFHTFYNAFSDDIVVDWCKSVYEHGIRLEKDYSSHNWLIMEMNGLIHIAVLNPWLKTRQRWQKLALDLLEQEIDEQFYPDGTHNELSTDYQYTVILNYARVMRLCKKYSVNVSDHIYEVIEHAILYYVKLMMPDGRTPSINDGELTRVKDIIEAQIDLYGNNEVFQNVITGKKPYNETGMVLEYPGLAMFRSGWSENDTYVCFDGGEFGAGHQHEDKLSFIMYANGRLALCEGNNYAYDDSEMRKYVMSSYSHNLVLVDSKGQNRSKNYEWHSGRLKYKSDMEYKLGAQFDFARGIYSEGFGENADSDVTHIRSIYFIKEPSDLKPFVICVDRMKASRVHKYEVLWHLDVDELEISGNTAFNDYLNVTCSNNNQEVKISSCIGQQTPIWQGWTADYAVQGCYHPVHCLTHTIYASDFRHVTVLYPSDAKGIHVKLVEASNDINDKSVCLTLSDNIVIDLVEF